MKIFTPQNAAEAIVIQNALKSKVCLKDSISSRYIKYIAGADTGYDLKNNISKAAIVVLTYPSLQVVEEKQILMETPFPYIPGLLSFREAPLIIKGYESLKHKPDLLMIDGHGVAHPRRLGIASHIGVLLDIPAIGVAKKKLCGIYEEPDKSKGSSSHLYDYKSHETIGTVLRSRSNVKPLYISAGHKISHQTSLEITLSCLGKYRLPEPTRLADKLSKFTL